MSTIQQSTNSDILCDKVACNCTLDTQNVQKCTSCKTGFKSDGNSGCTFDPNQVQMSGYNSIIVKNCLQQSNNYCNQCVSGYQNIYTCQNQCGYSCNYYCSYNGGYYQNHKDCKPYCYVSYCSLCSENDPNECIKCDESSYLYNKQCVQQCPENTSPNITIRQCIPCGIKCKACSQPNTCTQCQISDLQNLPSCFCNGSQFYFNKQCLQSCPLYYKKNIDQGICERICPANSYPYPNSQTQSTECLTPNSSDNDFCLYHLKNLSSLVSFRLQNNGDPNYYSLIAKFQQTPKICYQFLLFGKDNFQIQVSNISEQLDYIEIYYQFSKQDFENSNYFTCGVKSCQFKLKLQWGNQIQYIFKTNVNLDITGYLTSEVILNGDYKIVDVVCEDCVIPRDSIITSSIQKSCTSEQVCTDSAIFANINSLITITQKISDPQFINNKLLPHSIKLDYSNNGYQATIYIKTYEYNNNILGQITYSFYAMGVQNGKITITSIIKNAKVGRILSDISSQKVDIRYPQLSFDLKMKDPIQNQNAGNQRELDSTSDNSSTYIIIIVVLCLSFTIGIGSFCLYKRYKKNKKTNQLAQNVPKLQDEEVKQQQNDQILDIQQNHAIEQLNIKNEEKLNYLNDDSIKKMEMNTQSNEQQNRILSQISQELQQQITLEEKITQNCEKNVITNFDKEEIKHDEYQQFGQIIILQDDDEDDYEI